MFINLCGENRSILKYRCETTHNGHSLRLTKSAMQKYVRRGDFKKALYWVLQMYLMPFSPDKSHYYRTNLVNRLGLYPTEDISISESYLVKVSEQTLKNHSQVGDTPDKVNVLDIVVLIYLYCIAAKGRFGSHLHNFFHKNGNSKQ